MNIQFPKYPFVWNYEDMYLPLEYTNNIINDDEVVEIGDSNLSFLIELFPKSKIVKQIQKISKKYCQNINIHTWYLAECKIFETDNNSLTIETNSNLKYKADVFAFIFDPNDVFDKSIYVYDKKNTKYINIIKDKEKIIPNIIPKFYIHTHNIKGIFRFSPKDNSIIKFNDNVINPVFYTVLKNLIVINQVYFID